MLYICVNICEMFEYFSDQLMYLIVTDTINSNEMLSYVRKNK